MKSYSNGNFESIKGIKFKKVFWIWRGIVLVGWFWRIFGRLKVDMIILVYGLFLRVCKGESRDGIFYVLGEFCNFFFL